MPDVDWARLFYSCLVVMAWFIPTGLLFAIACHIADIADHLSKPDEGDDDVAD